MSWLGWLFSTFGLAIALATLVSVGYDIFALHHAPEYMTISGAIHDWSNRHPVIGPFLIGAGLFGTALALWLHFVCGWGID